MKIGLTMFATDVAIDPVELAVEAEARGFSSLWLPEHTHIPVSRETPWPWKPDEPLPEMYTRSMDPISVLSACAHATSTLTLATGVSLAAQHDPITYAKAWATLDVLSNGRARFGVGYGWNREEMRTHGVEFATRRAHAREHVLAMHELWGNDVAQFSGEHVSFESSFSWPKPVQRPRIPTYLGGGAGPKMFAAIAEFGDGWIPHGGGPRLVQLRDCCRQSRCCTRRGPPPGVRAHRMWCRSGCTRRPTSSSTSPVWGLTKWCATSRRYRVTRC